MSASHMQSVLPAWYVGAVTRSTYGLSASKPYGPASVASALSPQPCLDFERVWIPLLPEAFGANPRLSFRQVKEDGTIDLLGAPDIAGYPISKLYLSQYKQADNLSPGSLLTDWDATDDQMLGRAPWAFSTAKCHFVIYKESTTGRLVFDLYQTDGRHTTGGSVYSDGGSGVQVLAEDIWESPIAALGPRLDELTKLRFRGKLVLGSVSVAPGHTIQENMVQWQVYTGVCANLFDPAHPGRRLLGLFIQLPLANTLNFTEYQLAWEEQQAFLYTSDLDGYLQEVTSDSDQHQGFRDDVSPLRAYSYDIQRYLCDAMTKIYPYQHTDPDGTKTDRWTTIEEWSQGVDARELRNWRIWGAYIGLEVINTPPNAEESVGTATVQYRFTDFDVVKALGEFSPYAPTGRIP